VGTQPPAVLPEILAFARQEGVEQYLPGLIALSQRVFPSATSFEVLLEEDPEIADDRHIVLRLTVSLNVDQARDADLCWNRGAFEIVPAPLICAFRLSVDLRP
jgi:hypothetical protein